MKGRKVAGKCMEKNEENYMECDNLETQNKKIKKGKKRSLGIFFLSLFIISVFSTVTLLQAIPKVLYVKSENEEIHLDIPVRFEKETTSFVSSQNVANFNGHKANYYSCKLFGWIPIRQVMVETVEDKSVYPVGKTIGIYMKMDALLVAGTKELTDVNQVVQKPWENIVKTGDYICAVNGKSISQKEQLQSMVQQSKGEKMILTLRRNQEYIDVAIKPAQCGYEEYKLGIWVKDDMSGVGTMTYVTDDMKFGALGHGVSDSDSKNLVSMEQGTLYASTIASVEKGHVGNPGEITGVISYGNRNRIGTLEANTSSGVYGTIGSRAFLPENLTPYELGYKQDIKKDQATILFSLHNTVKAYQIMIDSIDYSDRVVNKSFRFYVTDEALLKETGGIVQGMFTSYNGYNTRKTQ